ncbi:hypothetical protein TYRP_002325 [Tyrophagus putrescentiae]|nr:hypothetical protein TYRP_002325 [Tyrophagus putrescentiae]
MISRPYIHDSSTIGSEKSKCLIFAGCCVSKVKVLSEAGDVVRLRWTVQTGDRPPGWQARINGAIQRFRELITVQQLSDAITKVPLLVDDIAGRQLTLSSRKDCSEDTLTVFLGACLSRCGQLLTREMTSRWWRPIFWAHCLMCAMVKPVLVLDW